MKCRSSRYPAGFTILELMVVIALVGLAVTYSAVKLRDYLPRARIQTAARDIGGFLTRLRGMAIFAGRPHYIEYDLDGEAFRITRPATRAEEDEGADEYIETDWFELPRNVVLEEVQFSERDAETRGIVKVEFTPNGEVTGHLVRLLSNEILDEERARFTLELNGITGLVSYHTGAKEYAQVRNEFEMR